jgi:diacylglycerol kinase family enzyme
LPREIEAVAGMITSGRTRQVSVGQAAQRYFLLMAGVGMDAAVVRAVNPALKRLAGQGAFWVAWVQHLVRWRPQAFVVNVDGRCCRTPKRAGIWTDADDHDVGLTRGGLRVTSAARRR